MTIYILAILATYRLARMVALEEGPLSLFEKTRDHFDPKQETWLGRGLNCPLCIGFWVALAMTCLLPFESFQLFVLSWWGIAGAQVLLQIGSER